MESSVYGYYGLYPYWGSGFYMGGYGIMGGGLGPFGTTGYLGGGQGNWKREDDETDYRRDNDDPHLRSAESVTGYHIHGSDGEVGHVEDFLIEQADWSIHYLIIDTRNWWPGKRIIMPPVAVRGISWSERRIEVALDRESIKSGPEYSANDLVDTEYQQKYYDYYRAKTIVPLSVK